MKELVIGRKSVTISDGDVVSSITPRMQELLLGAGDAAITSPSLDEIAESLNISRNAVQKHVRNLLRQGLILREEDNRIRRTILGETILDILIELGIDFTSLRSILGLSSVESITIRFDPYE